MYLYLYLLIPDLNQLLRIVHSPNGILEHTLAVGRSSLWQLLGGPPKMKTILMVAKNHDFQISYSNTPILDYYLQKLWKKKKKTTKAFHIRTSHIL